MEEKLKINLKIAGRAFPVNINREEEEIYRKAAKLVGIISDQYSNNINEVYRRNFLEPEDIFRMTAFHFALENLRLKSK